MGNYIEKSIVGRVRGAVSLPRHPQQLSNSIEDEPEYGDSLAFYIYMYRQHMQQKERQLLKWATAKLALTDELIRANSQRRHWSPREIRNIEGHRESLANNVRTYGRLEDGPEVGEDPGKEAGREATHVDRYRNKLLELLGHLQRVNTRRNRKLLKRKKFLAKCPSLGDMKRSLLHNVKRSRKTMKIKKEKI